MANYSFLSMLFALCFLTALVSSSVVSASGGDHYEATQLGMGWMVMPGMRSELFGEEDGEGEFELDSESNRRILAATRYISYGALQRNRVPCSRRGQSYYNCRPGAPVNPYSRGCSAITRCRS